MPENAVPEYAPGLQSESVNSDSNAPTKSPRARKSDITVTPMRPSPCQNCSANLSALNNVVFCISLRNSSGSQRTGRREYATKLLRQILPINNSQCCRCALYWRPPPPPRKAGARGFTSTIAHDDLASGLRRASATNGQLAIKSALRCRCVRDSRRRPEITRRENAYTLDRSAPETSRLCRVVSSRSRARLNHRCGRP